VEATLLEQSLHQRRLAATRRSYNCNAHQETWLGLAFGHGGGHTHPIIVQAVAVLGKFHLQQVEVLSLALTSSDAPLEAVLA
jgi:hypothetical protein